MYILYIYIDTYIDTYIYINSIILNPILLSTLANTNNHVT